MFLETYHHQSTTKETELKLKTTQRTRYTQKTSVDEGVLYDSCNTSVDPPCLTFLQKKS